MNLETPLKFFFNILRDQFYMTIIKYVFLFSTIYIFMHFLIQQGMKILND